MDALIAARLNPVFFLDEAVHHIYSDEAEMDNIEIICLPSDDERLDCSEDTPPLVLPSPYINQEDASEACPALVLDDETTSNGGRSLPRTPPLEEDERDRDVLIFGHEEDSQALKQEDIVVDGSKVLKRKAIIDHPRAVLQRLNETSPPARRTRAALKNAQAAKASSSPSPKATPISLEGGPASRTRARKVVPVPGHTASPSSTASSEKIGVRMRAAVRRAKERDAQSNPVLDGMTSKNAARVYQTRFAMRKVPDTEDHKPRNSRSIADEGQPESLDSPNTIIPNELDRCLEESPRPHLKTGHSGSHPDTDPLPEVTSGPDGARTGEHNEVDAESATSSPSTPATPPEDELEDKCLKTMRTITFEWPRPRLMTLLATRSLCHVTELSVPFRGPLSPTLLKRDSSDIVSREGWENEFMSAPRALNEPLVLGPFIMQGRVWSGFRSTFASTNEKLVTKFTSPSINGRWVMDETYREAWIYHHLLKDLWGSVVPMWHGVHVGYTPRVNGGSAEMLCAVLEDAGTEMKDRDFKKLPKDDKLVIINKYKALHEAGVVHRSARTKHWMLRPGAPISEMRIIDFGSSFLRATPETHQARLGGLDELDFMQHRVEEMRKVRTTLDYWDHQ